MNLNLSSKEPYICHKFRFSQNFEYEILLLNPQWRYYIVNEYKQEIIVDTNHTIRIGDYPMIRHPGDRPEFVHCIYCNRDKFGSITEDIWINKWEHNKAIIDSFLKEIEPQVNLFIKSLANAYNLNLDI